MVRSDRHESTQRRTRVPVGARGRASWMQCSCGLFLFLGFEASTIHRFAQGRAVEFKAVAIVNEAIEDCVGKCWFADHVVPGFNG